jgi:hypothetical protein
MPFDAMQGSDFSGEGSAVSVLQRGKSRAHGIVVNNEHCLLLMKMRHFDVPRC